MVEFIEQNVVSLVLLLDEFYSFGDFRIRIKELEGVIFGGRKVIFGVNGVVWVVFGDIKAIFGKNLFTFLNKLISSFLNAFFD